MFQTTSSAVNGQPPLHTLTQGENPTLVVGFIDMPLGGETRFDVGGLLAGPGEVPQNQRIVEIVADEAVALEALIGIAGRYRNVAGGHADGQCPCRLRAGSTEQRRPKTHRSAEAQRRLPQRSRSRHSAHLILPVTCIRSRRRALRSYGSVAPTVSRSRGSAPEPSFGPARTPLPSATL